MPQSFVDGAALADGTVVSRAGVFASKRNAPASEVVPVKFASFDVREKGVVAPTTGLDVTVNFQSELAPVPAGTLRDFGQPYEQRTSANQGDGAYTYGWVKEGTDEPFSLVKNGRDRDRTTGAASTDQRLDTILHMQYQDVPAGDCAANVCEDGSWNLDVDNGAYEVTVAVGDQPGANSVYDSLHAINLENQTTITGFQATAAKEYETVTQVVGVADGELTVSAVGGTNTKINYVRVKQLSPTVVDPRPFVVDVRPGNRSAGALRGEGIGTDLHLVGTTANPGPVDKTTISTSTVKLFEVVPGSADVAVAGNPGSTGGGDAINFQQSAALKADTTYRYVVDGVKDTLGNTFLPFTSTFTTGTEIDGGEETGTFSPVAGVNFEKVDLNKNGKYYSSLVVHQGYLWTTTVGQGMFRYPINADGTLGAEQAINAFAGRAAIGLVFDKTNPLVAWVTNASAELNNETNAFGSKVTRVDFTSSVTNPTLTDIFVNLPRSQKDHLSNSIGYGPGGDLYFLQGSNQAAGDNDGAWGNRGETLLTAAMLRFNPASVLATVQANGPIDVRTVDKGGSYDPFASGAPLTIYATGIRNAYDFNFNSNGHLYVAANGTASGGNSPGVTVSGSTATRTGQVSESATSACQTRRIDGSPYNGPTVPAVTNHNTQRDFLFDVEQGGYYGHPNPSRCEWVLNNGGNAEGAGSGGTKYAAAVQPDRNYRGWAYDFEFNKSPNGMVEYKSNAFGGKLKGRLLVVRFSNFDDVLTLQPHANGDVLGGQAGSTIGGFAGFDDPLDIVEDLEGNAGNLYVNSYDREGGSPKLYLLRVPTSEQGASVSANKSKLVGSQVTSAGSKQLGTVTFTNDGTKSVSVTAANITGAGAASFSRTVGSALPVTLAAGQSTTVTVGFDPTAEGVVTGTLALTLSEGTVANVALRGLGTDGEGGDLEPSLQYVLDVWGLGIDTGDDNDTTTPVHSDAAQRVSPTLGDSIDVESFKRFTDGPVTVEPLSVFGPTQNNPVTEVSWYDVAAPASLKSLFSAGNTPAGNGQTVTPVTTGALEFDPGESEFGFVSRWPYFANRLVHSQDALNTFSGAIGNHVRVYPLVAGRLDRPARLRRRHRGAHVGLRLQRRRLHRAQRRARHRHHAAHRGRGDQGQLPVRVRGRADRLPARLRSGVRRPLVGRPGHRQHLRLAERHHGAARGPDHVGTRPRPQPGPAPRHPDAHAVPAAGQPRLRGQQLQHRHVGDRRPERRLQGRGGRRRREHQR